MMRLILGNEYDTFTIYMGLHHEDGDIGKSYRLAHVIDVLIHLGYFEPVPGKPNRIRYIKTARPATMAWAIPSTKLPRKPRLRKTIRKIYQAVSAILFHHNPYPDPSDPRPLPPHTPK